MPGTAGSSGIAGSDRGGVDRAAEGHVERRLDRDARPDRRVAVTRRRSSRRPGQECGAGGSSEGLPALGQGAGLDRDRVEDARRPGAVGEIVRVSPAASHARSTGMGGSTTTEAATEPLFIGVVNSMATGALSWRSWRRSSGIGAGQRHDRRCRRACRRGSRRRHGTDRCRLRGARSAPMQPRVATQRSAEAVRRSRWRQDWDAQQRDAALRNTRSWLAVLGTAPRAVRAGLG